MDATSIEVTDQMALFSWAAHCSTTGDGRQDQNVQVRLATRIYSLIRVSLKTSTSTLRQARQDRCTFTYKVLGISWNRGFVLLPLAPENYTRENQVSQIEPARGDIENSPTDNLLGKKTHLNVKVNNCRAS